MKGNIIKLAAIGLIVWSQGAQAAVDSYRTELFLKEPGVDGIKTVVFEWSTSETSGMINANELVDYSVSIYVGSSLLYRDDVLVDGVLQPLNSVDRDYPFWDFDLDTLTLRQFTPGSINILTSRAVTGTHYHVADWASLPEDSIVYVQKFVDGFQSDWSISYLLSQRTFNVNAHGVVHQVHVGGPDICSGIDQRPGCDGNFSLTANLFSDGEANGRWTDRFGHGTGMTAAIDCLLVVDNEAWVSGYVVATNSPNYVLGQAVATRVRDNGVSNLDLPDETSFSIPSDTPCTDAREYLLVPYVEGQVTIR